MRSSRVKAWDIVSDPDNMMILLMSGTDGGSSNLDKHSGTYECNGTELEIIEAMLPEDYMDRIMLMVGAGIMVWVNNEAYATDFGVACLSTALRIADVNR